MTTWGHCGPQNDPGWAHSRASRRFSLWRHLSSCPPWACSLTSTAPSLSCWAWPARPCPAEPAPSWHPQFRLAALPNPQERSLSWSSLQGHLLARHGVPGARRLLLGWRASPATAWRGCHLGATHTAPPICQGGLEPSCDSPRAGHLHPATCTAPCPRAGERPSVCPFTPRAATSPRPELPGGERGMFPFGKEWGWGPCLSHRCSGVSPPDAMGVKGTTGSVVWGRRRSPGSFPPWPEEVVRLKSPPSLAHGTGGTFMWQGRGRGRKATGCGVFSAGRTGCSQMSIAAADWAPALSYVICHTRGN